MHNALPQKIKIVGVHEAVRLSPAELAGWNVLSIRGRLNEPPLDFPGAQRTKSLHFDDVLADCPEYEEFAATAEDIQAALEFSRSIGDERLLIHCAAGISRSTAVAWIILYDRLKASEADAVYRAFDMVRKLRPILAPNRHVLRLGINALVPGGSRQAIMRQFRECLIELNSGDPVYFPDEVDAFIPAGMSAGII